MVGSQGSGAKRPQSVAFSCARLVGEADETVHIKLQLLLLLSFLVEVHSETAPYVFFLG